MDSNSLANIHDRLTAFERMTWAEVDKVKSCGPMSVNEMDKVAQERLAEIGRDEYDELYKLRIGKAARLWGVRSQHVFHILWWDPDHLVYPINITDN